MHIMKERGVTALKNDGEQLREAFAESVEKPQNF